MEKHFDIDSFLCERDVNEFKVPLKRLTLTVKMPSAEQRLRLMDKHVYSSYKVLDSGEMQFTAHILALAIDMINFVTGWTGVKGEFSKDKARNYLGHDDAEAFAFGTLCLAALQDRVIEDQEETKN